MTSKLYPDALGYTGAIEAASIDRAAWSLGERAHGLAASRIGDCDVLCIPIDRER
jgi:hypothetical protein